MLLSEMIRLGSMATEKCEGHWADGEARCAIGAAMTAAGIIPATSLRKEITDTQSGLAKKCEAMFPILGLETRHPVCGRNGYVGRIIIDLNDCCSWSGEDIADWVATIEPKETETTPEPIEEQVHA